MLDAGGSAADAAVATAFALAAVEPWNSGLGGIGFAQVMAPDRPAETFDFGPVAPAALDPRAFPLTGRMKQDLFAWPEVEGDRNIHGPLSFVIPSAVAGYALLHERHGRLPLREVLAPAIALARRGLPADWYTTLKVANSAAVLRLYPGERAHLPAERPAAGSALSGDAGLLRPGQSRGDAGAAGRGRVARLLRGRARRRDRADVREMGGILSAADLAGCRARVLPALAVPWAATVAGGRLLLLANGLTAAPTLRRVLEGMAGALVGRCRALPRLVCALRPGDAGSLCRAAGGPRRVPSRSAAESCTTHLTACDRDGMMVAMTTTLLSSMGSRVVLPRSGVLMNNGVMWFDPTPGAPNAMAPGKRPLTNMCPVIAAGRGRARPEIAARGLRRAAHPGRGGADAVLRGRVRHGPGGSGAPSAHRRLRAGRGVGGRSPAGRGAGPAARGRSGARWWSTASCRSTSPAPT